MSKLWLGKCLFVCVIGINCGSFLCGAWAQEPPTAGGGAATAPVSRPATTDATRQGTPAGMPAVQNVPRLIKFSGTLKDSKGQPKSGVAGVTFAIYAEQEGGAPLWMETQNVTFEEGGKYTVLLGANSNEGVPMELFTTQWRVASGGWRVKREADPSLRWG